MADIITATEYKSYAGITATTWDTPLATLVTAISIQIRRYCGRDLSTGFESATWTHYFDGSETEYLQLSEWPLASITSIATLDDAGTATTVTSTDYRTELATGRVYYLGAVAGRFAGALDSFGGGVIDRWGTYPRWPLGFNNIKVIYVTSAGVPVDVKYAAYRMVDLAFSNRARGDMKSESLGGYSYTRADVTEGSAPGLFTAEVKALLDQFRTGGGNL